jgi:septum formation protein
MKHILLLGSKSSSRKALLTEARIPFKVVSQDADETQCDWGLPLEQVVSSIALHKMEHVVLPVGTHEGELCFVLTADTLSQDIDGTIHGKPVDRADAIKKIKSARNGTRLCTAFCVDRRIWSDGVWEVDRRIQEHVCSSFVFNIPDEWIEIYLQTSPGLQTANAIAVEGYGALFLKEVRGSHSAIIGLPMYEVREALERIGFFAQCC